MTDFILQAVTASTHGSLLKEFFGKPATNQVIISTAFLTRGGVGALKSELKSLGANTTVYAGIRNGITTAEGLAALLELSVNIYVVDTGMTSPIFHPKVYLRLGKSTGELIVGSANLTTSGLYNNIEGSLIHKLDFKVNEHVELADKVASSLSNMIKDYPTNVFQITKLSEIDALVEAGRLVSEEALQAAIVEQKSSAKKQNPKSIISRMKLKTRAPRFIRKKKRPTSAAIVVPVSKSGKAIPPDDGELELLWSSGPLKRRDLNIPTAKNTAVTGSMLLKKGDSEIDQQTYFREMVFNDFDWIADERTLGKELTTVPFQLVIDGVDYGVKQLTVTHDTRTHTASYKQKQPMSAIRWGESRALVAKEDYLNKTMRLYKDPDEPSVFILAIN